MFLKYLVCFGKPCAAFRETTTGFVVLGSESLVLRLKIEKGSESRKRGREKHIKDSKTICYALFTFKGLVVLNAPGQASLLHIALALF